MIIKQQELIAMLKLVAVDMDGTLLNDAKEMPESTFEIVDCLHKRGIIFAVASGRQHLSLQYLYDEIKDDIVFIAGNGSIIIDKGKVIFADTLDLDFVNEIVEAVDKFPALKVILSGLRSAYMFEENILSDMPIELVESHFPVYTIIKSLAELPADEEIIQIAIFDPEYNSKENIYEKLKHFEDRCHLTISGSEWLDIMNIGVNKGVGIKKMQAILDATPEETMVFGDELNDYEMMQQAYYSYAMANAVPKIKEIANFTAPSNEDEGVIKILENFLAMTKYDV